MRKKRRRRRSGGRRGGCGLRGLVDVFGLGVLGVSLGVGVSVSEREVRRLRGLRSRSLLRVSMLLGTFLVLRGGLFAVLVLQRDCDAHVSRVLRSGPLFSRDATIPKGAFTSNLSKLWRTRLGTHEGQHLLDQRFDLPRPPDTPRLGRAVNLEPLTSKTPSHHVSSSVTWGFQLLKMEFLHHALSRQ